VVSKRVVKKSNGAKPPWLTKELKPNRKLFPDHLSSILPSRVHCWWVLARLWPLKKYCPRFMLNLHFKTLIIYDNSIFIFILFLFLGWNFCLFCHIILEKNFENFVLFSQHNKVIPFAKSKQSFSSNTGCQCGWWMVYIHPKANSSKALGGH
jgi:hypothetical protein